MRYGVMSTQMSLLVPPNLPAVKLGGHLATFNHADLVRKIAEAGFPLIELGGDLEMLLPQLYSPQAITDLATIKQELGLNFTIHLPLWSVEPSTPLTPVRTGSVEATINHIKTVAPLEPEVYVFHATGALAAEFYRMKLPAQVKQYLLGQFQNGARESIKKILAETGIPSRKLAIETIEYPFELTLALAEELDLSICFDTGHILAGFSGEIEFFNALERSLSRIAEFHLHDCPVVPGKISYGQDHQPLGSGNLDVGRFLRRLDDFGFAGPVIFELELFAAAESLDVIHSFSKC
jgi:sugar phosphate isomerase/epimerase